MKLLKRLLNNKIVGISSSGGHLTELQSSIPQIFIKKVIYLTSKDGRTIESLNKSPHFFVLEPNGVSWKYAINLFQSLILFLMIRPKIVISTGSGLAIPFLLISKLFGSKIIFIESGARIYTASKTGRFMYKHSDIFIVQYKNLLKFYPNAIVGSLN